MTTIELIVETLDGLVKNQEEIIAGIETLYARQPLADEDLSIVIRGNAGDITPEDALVSFKKGYSQYFTAKYEEWEGANPWKAAVKELFDFRTNAKDKLAKHAMIAGVALMVFLGRAPHGPTQPVLGAATGGALEGVAYLDSSAACRKKEQFYYDLVNASISVEEVTVRKVE